MDEKQKMLAGELFDPYGSEDLITERDRAKRLSAQFNRLDPTEREEQQRLLHELLGAVGESVRVVAPFHCDYGYNIKLGDDVFLNFDCTMLDIAPITIGDHCMIGPGCGFYAVGHPLDIATRNTHQEYGAPITVGDSVWFGARVMVNPGVTIGEGAVIGTGSVVTKDIPPHVVAAGNPCRVIKEIDNGQDTRS